MKIDKTKLSRDFYKYPITRTDGPTKADIEYIFSCNPHTHEIREALNTTNWTFYKWATKYGVSRPQASADASLASRVDYSRLSRDYRVKPLQYMEFPPKEDVLYLYKEVHLTYAEMSLVFGRGNSCSFGRKCMKHYDICAIVNPLSRDKARETYRKKTGYDHPYHNPEFIAKMKEKYGYENPLQFPESIRKMRSVINTPEMIERAKKTRSENNIKKYGIASTSQVHIPKESLEILNNKEALAQLYAEGSSAYVGAKLGVTSTCVDNYRRKHGIPAQYCRRASKGQKAVEETLDWVKFRTDRTVIAPMEIDLYSDEYKIGVEFNGNYWHSEKNKSSTYHQEKMLAAEEKGVFLYNLYEYEWETPELQAHNIDNLNRLFGKYKEHISASDCYVEFIPDFVAKAFFLDNHYPGDAQGYYALGLVYNNELVYVMEFRDKHIPNKEADWCIGRDCMRTGLVVDGAAEAVFSCFLAEMAPKTVVSYQDLAKSNGAREKLLGFVPGEITQPRFTWVKDHRVITRAESSRKAMIATGMISANDKRKADIILQDNGYYKLHDCGKRVWYYKAH